MGEVQRSRNNSIELQTMANLIKNRSQHQLFLMFASKTFIFLFLINQLLNFNKYLIRQIFIYLCKL
jgi:hypothetical protein